MPDPEYLEALAKMRASCDPACWEALSLCHVDSSIGTSKAIAEEDAAEERVRGATLAAIAAARATVARGARAQLSKKANKAKRRAARRERAKASGPCEPGQTAAQTGCTPEAGAGGSEADSPAGDTPEMGKVRAALAGIKNKAAELAGGFTDKLVDSGVPAGPAKAIAGAAAISMAMPVTWTAVLGTAGALATGGAVPAIIWAIPGFVEGPVIMATAMAGGRAGKAVKSITSRLRNKAKPKEQDDAGTDD